MTCAYAFYFNLNRHVQHLLTLIIRKKIIACKSYLVRLRFKVFLLTQMLEVEFNSEG